MHFCPYPLITRLGCLGGSRRNGRAAHHIVHSLHGLSSMGGFHRLFLSLVSLSTVPVDVLQVRDCPALSSTGLLKQG